MKEIVVISGKGGTGKTSITASFSWLGGKEVITADCDVDAADMHLLMRPDFSYEEDFYSGKTAFIDKNKCIRCMRCYDKCRFNAVEISDGRVSINEMECEGCGYCSLICLSGAIEMRDQNVGKCYISSIKTGGKMVHAKLKAGSENSGKLVAKVKNEARRIAGDFSREIIIVDGSPGIGCPVVSSLSGADFVVFVTEPTVSGLHDLKRVYLLVKKFGIKSGCIINKYDLNRDASDKIISFLKSENIIHIANLPYDEDFTKAMTDGKTVTELDGSFPGKELQRSWETVKDVIS